MARHRDGRYQAFAVIKNVAMAHVVGLSATGQHHRIAAYNISIITCAESRINNSRTVE